MAKSRFVEARLRLRTWQFVGAKAIERTCHLHQLLLSHVRPGAMGRWRLDEQPPLPHIMIRSPRHEREPSRTAHR